MRISRLGYSSHRSDEARKGVESSMHNLQRQLSEQSQELQQLSESRNQVAQAYSTAADANIEALQVITMQAHIWEPFKEINMPALKLLTGYGGLLPFQATGPRI